MKGIKSAVSVLTVGGALIVSPVVNASTNNSNMKPLSYYLGNTTPYTQPVNISVGWQAIPSPGFSNGHTQENNGFVTYVQKKLNVNLQWSFLTANDSYDQKVGLSIASGNIPDVMEVNYQQLKQLEAADLIQPLTSAYSEYASPYIKSIYTSFNNSPLKMATYNGQLMAIPDTQIGYQFDQLWIRADWLKKLNLQPPKTVSDVEKIARAFVQHHMGGSGTVGLIGVPQLTAPNSPGGFDTVFGAYGAYPGQWLEKNGKVYYGSVQPEMKAALQQLHNWYSQGLIDRQFPTRSSNDEIALVANNKTGLLFGPWWMPYWPLNSAMVNDPHAEWVPYITPLDSHGKLNVVDPLPSMHFVVVKKGFTNPEAVMKIINVDQAGQRNLDPAQINVERGQGANWANRPLLVQLDFYDAVLKQYQLYQEGLAAKSPPADNTSPQYAAYNEAKQYKADPIKSVSSAWPDLWARTVGTEPMVKYQSKVNELHPVNFVETSTQHTRWAELSKLESQTLLGIVIGQYPISQFDKFVNQWNALGGVQITKEIQQQVDQSK